MKRTAQHPNPIPFSVIGGFLGAGKTTLLNRLLVAPDAPTCAVLVNDFGDIAVDESLVASHGGDTIALKNGCVCCTIGDDLGRALARVLDAPVRPAHIVVEASGVANPRAVAAVARVSPELMPAGVFVLADAAAVGGQLADKWIGDTVARQLQGADCIAVSKLDAVSPAEEVAVAAMLTRRFGHCAVVSGEEVGWARLLRVKTGATVLDGADGHAPHAEFVARTLRSDSRVDLRRLQRWIANADGVYRLKGWAADENGDCKLIQAVGRRVNISDCDAAISEAFLAVVIGRELPQAEVILGEWGVSW